MSSVDDRIVALKFDNGTFLTRVSSTINALARLKESLNFSASQKGMNDLQNSANRFSLGNVGNAASGVSGAFLAMATVAVTALSNIVNRAVDAGIQITKALTIDPIKAGLREYETNLNSVQTILANTQVSGATLQDVNATLQELNEYSDQTIYNFSQMAKNIGTFTAAGVDLETSAASIKGIANLAALSGSNAEQAATAMYQLSQAIASGKVGLQDWNSVVNAGMGGSTFQRALAQTAVAMGTLEESSLTLEGAMKNVTIDGASFRDSIMAGPGKESWLTSDVLTTTLKQFTGDMTDAELAAQGFTEAQIKEIQAMAQTAKLAATEVKTLSGVFDTAKEVLGSGWALTWQTIFGDFEQAKTLFTSMSNSVNGFIGGMTDARNELLKGWADLGGRDTAITAIQEGFKGILTILDPIKRAFRDIFPPITVENLITFTNKFAELMKQISIGFETTERLRRTFRGFFAIFSIIGQVLGGALGMFGDLFGVIGKGSGGFLEFTATVGDWLTAVDKALKEGSALTTFFETLGAVISFPITVLQTLTGLVWDFFDSMGSAGNEGLSEYLAKMAERLSPLTGLLTNAGDAWGTFVEKMKETFSFLQPLVDAIGQAVSNIGDTLVEIIKAKDFDGVLDIINTALLGGIVLLVKKFLGDGLNIDFGGGLLEGINDSFGALTDTLGAMQTQLQAKTLMLIAAAIAALTISVVALSMIDSENLTKALTAMSVAFAQLLASMAILVKIAGAAGFVKVPIIAGAMILLAGAVLILVASVAALSQLEWDELARGLTGVGALLAGIVATAYGLNFAGGALIRTGLAMLPLAVAIKILASAVGDFAQLSWSEIGRGLAALAGSLLLIAGAMWIMPPHMLLQAASMVLIGAAIKILADALTVMGDMTWKEIGKGLALLAGSLLLIAGAMWIMPPHMLLQAAGLVVVGAALAIIAKVMKQMGKASWEEIAKALVTLAGALAIIAGGLYLMTGALPGAAALLVVSSALSVLAPILVILGAMSWESIAKGLVALAGAFAVIGIAGLVLTPLIPVLLGLGAAILIIGAGFALAGVGALALATAFSIFVTAATGATVAVGGLIALIPAFLTKLAEGIIGFATTIANSGAAFTGAFAKLIGSLLDAIITISPKLEEAITALLKMLLDIIVENIPAINDAGYAVLFAFLDSIRDNIGEVTTVVSDIMVEFINALSANLPRVIQAGYNFIINFINSLSNAVDRNSGPVGEAGSRLGMSIVKGMIRGLANGASQVAKMSADVARQALDAAKRALGIASPSKEYAEVGRDSDRGLARGLELHAPVVTSAAKSVAMKAVETISDILSSIHERVKDDLQITPVVTPVMDWEQY